MSTKWAIPAKMSPTLRMEVHSHIGGRPDAAREVVAGERIRFVNIEDDRVAFDVVALADGSLEIRGVDTVKVNGVLTGTRLSIEPHVTNVIRVSRLEWDK